MSLTHSVLTAYAAAVPNPFDNIVPDFAVFGGEFNTLWKKLLGAAWALALIYTGVMFLKGVASVASHKAGSHPQQVAESRAEAVQNGIAFGAVAAFGVIIGAIVALAS